MATENKRGQAAMGTAVLLAVIMGSIVMYIILIPPQDRAELLDEPYSSSSTTGGAKELSKATVSVNLMQESPRRIDYLSQNQIEHPLPVINIYTKTESKVLAEKNVAYAKKGSFSEEIATFSFDVPDLKHSANFLLTFKVENADGPLRMFLNGDEVFNSEITTGDSLTITLPANKVKETNELSIAATSPGLAFWATNEININNMKVVAEVTSTEAQSSKNIFLISEVEKKNLEKLVLQFKPDCIFEEVGKLYVTINGEEIYSGVPDCDLTMVPIEFSPNMIHQGENSLVFRTEKGNYVLSHVVIKSNLKEIDYPTYYFDLSNEQYDAVIAGNNRVRLSLEFVDVVTSKYGTIVFNGHQKHFDTKEVSYVIDLSDDIVKVSNSVKIKPEKTIEVRMVRVDLVK